MPITRQDYDEPLTLVLSGGEVVSLDVTSNASIEVAYKVNEHGSIHIDPFLLNPKESIIIRAVIINKRPNIRARTRIIGGELMRSEEFDNTAAQRLKRSITSDSAIKYSAIVITILAVRGLAQQLTRTITSIINYILK